MNGKMVYESLHGFCYTNGFHPIRRAYAVEFVFSQAVKLCLLHLKPQVSPRIGRILIQRMLPRGDWVLTRIQKNTEASVEQSDDRYVPLVLERSVARAGDMVGKPAPVGGRHHTIIRPVPDDGGACIGNAEAPIAHDCEFVIPQSCYSVFGTNSQRLCEPFGEFSRHLCLVGLR